MNYKLDGHDPVPVDDTLEWARWLETADRRVASDVIGRYHVSTVFLGTDHNFTGNGGCPLLFETMVFVTIDPSGNRRYALDIQHRYCTWDEAVAGHDEVKKKMEWRLRSEQ